MATTTNYGWTTPNDTDLVKDGASAIRTLGSSIDTTTKNLNPSTTLGDIEYRSSTANTNTRLGIGTSGQVLTVAGGVPTWATPAAGGGKILQVIQDTVTAEVSTNSTSMVDTGLDVTITPSSSSSKILIMATLGSPGKVSGNVNTSMGIEIVRDSSRIYYGADTALFENESDYLYLPPSTFNYLDSPATTSATTYKVRFCSYVSGQSVAINKTGGVSNTVISTLIVMEVGA